MEWQFPAGDRKCWSLAQASGLPFSDADPVAHADSDRNSNGNRDIHPNADGDIYSDGHCDVYPDAHCDSDSNGNCSCNRKRFRDGDLLLKSCTSANSRSDDELYRNYQWLKPNGWFG